MTNTITNTITIIIVITITNTNTITITNTITNIITITIFTKYILPCYYKRILHHILHYINVTCARLV